MGRGGQVLYVFNQTVYPFGQGRVIRCDRQDALRPNKERPRGAEKLLSPPVDTSPCP